MKWLLLVLLAGVCGAQEEPQKRVPKVVPVPVPRQAEPEKAPGEPTEPPARTVEDARTGVTLRLPAGWAMTRKDGEVSTFLNDARSAPKSSQLRLAASMGWNPYPHSTFSGALFYLSVAAHSSKAACAAQTDTKPDTQIEPAVIDDVRFLRGKDEHGRICTQARDIAYTSFRGGMCVRFDLAVNNFCGGDVSGAQEITDAELGNVFGRMEGILQTVRFARH